MDDKATIDKEVVTDMRTLLTAALLQTYKDLTAPKTKDGWDSSWYINREDAALFMDENCENYINILMDLGADPLLMGKLMKKLREAYKAYKEEKKEKKYAATKGTKRCYLVGSKEWYEHVA